MTPQELEKIHQENDRKLTDMIRGQLQEYRLLIQRLLPESASGTSTEPVSRKQMRSFCTQFSAETDQAYIASHIRSYPAEAMAFLRQATRKDFSPSCPTCDSPIQIAHPLKMPFYELAGAVLGSYHSHS